MEKGNSILQMETISKETSKKENQMDLDPIIGKVQLLMKEISHKAIALAKVKYQSTICSMKELS